MKNLGFDFFLKKETIEFFDKLRGSKRIQKELVEQSFIIPLGSVQK
jgi:hypothetical protein